MNSLSLLLYFSEILPSVATLGVTVIVFYIIGRSLYSIIGCLWAIHSNEQLTNKKKFMEDRKWLPKTKEFLLVIGTLLLLMFIPSKQTILLIAASEAGESLVTSPESKQILGDVQEIIHLQLESLKVGVQNESSN